MSDRTWDEWIHAYAQSHVNPVNRWCHRIGIPMIALAVLLAATAIAFHPLVYAALALFVLGWIFQFIGHAFEGKPPELFRDWRFVFVGLRWWLKKGIRGRAPTRR